MKKNKLVLGLSVVVSLLFVIFLVKTVDDLGNVERNLSKSPNVEDVTDKIQSKLLITPDNLTEGWFNPSFNDVSWKPTNVPKDWIVSEPNFKEGNFGYYRIHVPKEAIKKFSHLKDESVINLYFVMFSRVDIYVNGQFYATNKPTNYNETIVDVPIKENQDNVIALKGYIKAGDQGLYHRGRIFAGKKAETNEMHRKSYKGVTVVSLIYILCKGSIFLIFTLIFFVVKTEKYFETSLLFSMFVILEDIVTGDYITHLINFNQLVYLYDLANIGYIACLYLFLSQAMGLLLTKKFKLAATGFLLVSAALVTVDTLFTTKFITVDGFLKFWNLALMLVLIIFIPKLYRKQKILASILVIALIMTGWTTFFSANVGLNLKAFANLLIFFTVAYQTFLLFREQQNQLLEQEKDVAIGKTAAVLAHDVRRPLDQMNLILSRIIEGAADEEFLKVAQKDIQFSLNAVNNQISDVMNFSRSVELELKPISLYSVLLNSLKQSMSIVENVDISLKYDFRAKNYVMGEESRLASALTNVLTNAVEAIRDIGKMKSGEIEITTKVEGEYLVLNIANNGPLIPGDQLEKIFKPLYTSGKSKGTGLGLASVAKIMKDHKGKVEVNNLGERVVFSLFFQKASELETSSNSEFKTSANDYGYVVKETIKKNKVIRLFVLDDDKYVFEYLKDLAKKCDYEIELSTFRNYEEARDALKSKRFDLHLIDHDLGGSESGLDFYTNCLKELKTVVALHSGRSDLSLPDSNITAVDKPISLTKLNSLLAEADRKRFKILLIEDSKLIGVAWKMFHGSENIKVFTNPEEGLKYFEGHMDEIDACVVDYHFDNSSMNGRGVIIRLREIQNSIECYLMTNSDEVVIDSNSISKSNYDLRISN